MTTILFGAGASRGFFNPDLCTSYLTEQVKDINNWTRVINEYKKFNQSTNVYPNPQCVTRIIGSICALNNDYNFEQIGECLDKLCSYCWDYMPKNTYIASIIHLFCQLTRQNSFPQASELGIVPFLFRQIIAEAILDLQQNHVVNDYDKYINLQTEFIKYIADSDADVNLVSFNYDDLVITSALHNNFSTGFENSAPNVEGLSLNVERFFTAKKVVYFPHGHIRFRYTDSTNISYYNDSVSANTQRLTLLASSSIGSTTTITPGKFAYNFNTFLTTGQTKDDSLNFEPYAYFYQRLANDFLHSDTIIIIGYSFGDQHINRLLQSYLQTSNTHKLYIVDMIDTPIRLVPDTFQPEGLLFNIYHTFKTQWLVNYDADTGMWYTNRPMDEANLNDDTIGFGEIFDRVYLYRKGYLNFLQEYKKFIPQDCRILTCIHSIVNFIRRIF